MTGRGKAVPYYYLISLIYYLFFCNNVAYYNILLNLQQYCTIAILRSLLLKLLNMRKLLVFLCILSISFSCKKEDLEPVDDNELITTVDLTFTDSNKKVNTFSFQDKDGDAKTPPEKFDKIVLDKNMNYSLEINVYDETKNPKANITEQIKLESDVHLFVFKIDPASLFSLKAIDKDKNGLPIGLLSSGSTQNTVGSGKLNLVLKHQPPINGKAVKTGNEAGGSSDIDLVFDLSIK